MTKLYLTLMNALPHDEEGQGLVEYGLILALIAVIVMGAVALIGTNALAQFNLVAAELE
jgi:pilus assembly protein Flp/PilA